MEGMSLLKRFEEAHAEAGQLPQWHLFLDMNFFGLSSSDPFDLYFWDSIISGHITSLASIPMIITLVGIEQDLMFTRDELLKHLCRSHNCLFVLLEAIEYGRKFREQ